MNKKLLIIILIIILIIFATTMSLFFKKEDLKKYNMGEGKGEVLIEYRLLGGESRINNVLTIYETGFSTYLLTNPFDTSKEHEAGYYEGQIDLKEANSFIEILQKMAKQIPKRLFVPDEVIARYKFVEQGKENSFAVSQNEIPGDAWEKTGLITQKLMEKPVWTISLEAYNLEKEGLNLEFIIKNRGNQAIQISNPWVERESDPSHTNFIIDGFPADYNKTDYWPSEDDSLIREMNITREQKIEESDFIDLAPGGETKIQCTPHQLVDFCKRKSCVIQGIYEGIVKAPNQEPLRVNIYSNSIEAGLNNK